MGGGDLGADLGQALRDDRPGDLFSFTPQGTAIRDYPRFTEGPSRLSVAAKPVSRKRGGSPAAPGWGSLKTRPLEGWATRLEMAFWHLKYVRWADSDSVIPAEAGIQVLSAAGTTEPMEPQMSTDERGLGSKSQIVHRQSSIQTVSSLYLCRRGSTMRL